jgi:hypothetical protein
MSAFLNGFWGAGVFATRPIASDIEMSIFVLGSTPQSHHSSAGDAEEKSIRRTSRATATRYPLLVGIFIVVRTLTLISAWRSR